MWLADLFSHISRYARKAKGMWTVDSMYAANMIHYRPRSLIGSDAIIMGASIVHLFEAFILLGPDNADESEPIWALMGTIPLSHNGLGWLLISVACLAIIGTLSKIMSPVIRTLMLLPQFSLLFITAIGAIVLMMFHGDHWPPAQAIACDHAPRELILIMYAVASHNRIVNK